MIRTSSGRLASHIRGLLAVATNSSSNQQIHQSTTNYQTSKEEDKYGYYSATEGYIRNSKYGSIEIPDMTLDQYTFRNIPRWSNSIATECVVTGRKYTYAKLYDCSTAFAINLQKKFKLKPRDVAAICMPNLPEYPIAALGTMQAGVTVTTMNPIYTSEEIARQLVISNAKLLIGIASNYKVLKEACDIAKRKLPIVCIRHNKDDLIPEGVADFFEMIDVKNVNFGDLKATDIKSDDIAFLPFSSGTTGLPKGVCLTHRNIVSNAEMVVTTGPYGPFMLEAVGTKQDVMPTVLPLFHIFGFTINLVVQLNLGSRLVTVPKFTPDDLIKSLTEYDATSFLLVPPILLFLTNHSKVTPEAVKNLRCVMSGAAPIGMLDVEKFRAKFPHVDFLQGFGLTESSPALLIGHKGLKNYASAGLPCAGTEAKVVGFSDGKYHGLGPNETGELWFRGPQIMKGYLNNEEATRDILVEGNWLRTGDVGHYDENGYFYVTDRIKELIKVKGFQVPPAELEELLRDHPKVLDAAVIGVPHNQLGEAPKAFIVLRDKQQATADEIKEFLAGKVAAYKKLEGGVQFLKEIPKTASGKILRKDLRSMSS